MTFYTFESLIYTYEPILKLKLIIGRLFTFKRPFPLKMPLLGRYDLLSDQTDIENNPLGVYQAYITFCNDEHKTERECPLSKKRFLLKMPLLGRYYLLSDQTYIENNPLGVYQAYITFYNDEHKKERECPLSKKRFLLSCLFLRRFKHRQC